MKTFVQLIWCLFLSVLSLSAQEDGIGSGLVLRGSLAASGESYAVNGIDNRRPGYSYNLVGSLSLGYGELSVPVSFNLRDAQFSYDYTFNRYGISPTYKWAKFHLGWRSMRFSQYTMAGRSFFGVGIELNPGKLTFSALRGEIQNPLAIRDSLVYGATLIPVYDRKIMGGKIGFKSGRNRIELIAMKVWDDESSFQYPETYDDIYPYQLFSPKENIVGGLNFTIVPFRNLEIYANTGISGFTGDVNDPLTETISGELPASVQDIYTVNSSTNVDIAGDAGINLRIKNYTIGLKARRVGSFYTTLASNYFPNDLLQYTFNLGASMMKRKVTFNGDIGFEQNNLSNYRTNTTNRVIGNASLNISPTKNFYTNFSYSNFQTESENQILTLNDTLRFVSVSQQVSAFSGYTINSDARDYRLSVNAFYNKVDDQSEAAQLDDIEIISVAGSVGALFKNLQLNITPGIHYYRYTYDDVIQNRYGANLKLTKNLLDKKLKTSLSGSYSYNDYNDRNDGNASYFSMQITYRTGMRGSITLNSTYRISNSILDSDFTEWRTRIRYGQNF